jgi:hypothetical protein
MWTLSVAFAAEPTTAAVLAPLGTDHLDQVGEITFTFNVAKDGNARPGRTWTWRPADGTVTRRIGDQVTTFVFGRPTNDEEKKADAQFVNDSFWLLPELHLRWAGSDLTLTDEGVVPRPVGEGTAHKVVAQYAPSGGGYTPGDAYDLYLDESGRIVAWSYRAGGKPEPDLTTTFEQYQQVGPLEIATEHQTADHAFRLFFTDLKVTPK